MSARRADAADPQQSAEEVILGLALSYLASRSLHVANELGIADLLKDGPQDVEELARATGAQQQSLYRLLRMFGRTRRVCGRLARTIPINPSSGGAPEESPRVST